MNFMYVLQGTDSACCWLGKCNVKTIQNTDIYPEMLVELELFFPPQQQVSIEVNSKNFLNIVLTLY